MPVHGIFPSWRAKHVPAKAGSPPSTTYPGECSKDVDADLRRHDGGVATGGSLSTAPGSTAPGMKRRASSRHPCARCAYPSRTNVISMVTRYSSICPFFTLAFSSMT